MSWFISNPISAVKSDTPQWFDPERLGRGFGTETTRLVVDYAFGSLALERLEVTVLEINERALRCYRRFGFRETRRIQGAALIDGQSFDDIVMELRTTDATQ